MQDLTPEGSPVLDAEFFCSLRTFLLVSQTVTVRREVFALSNSTCPLSRHFAEVARNLHERFLKVVDQTNGARVMAVLIVVVVDKFLLNIDLCLSS
jgi:hypothetical protein